MKNLIRITVFSMLFAAVAIKVPSALAVDILVERDRKVPIAYINVVLRNGAIADPEKKTGLTSFVGDMLLRGTQQHTKEEIDLLLDQWGASLEVDTRLESVVIRSAVLSKKTPELLSLLTEVLSAPLFPQSEIDKLKQETLSSILAQKANDHSVATQKFSQFFFGAHLYGRPIVGLPSEIESFTRDLLIQHHQQIFRKRSLLVLAVGDIEESRIQRWADQLGEQLPKIGTEKIGSAPVFGAHYLRRLQIVDKPERTQTQIFIGQHGIKMTDADYYALYLGNAAFGGGSFSSRLMQEIRVKRGWSYGASSNFRFALQPHSWRVHLFPAEKDTAEALAYALKMISDLKENGITQEEFDLAKSSSINSSAFINDTPKKRIENQLTETNLGLPPGFFESFSKNLSAVTRDQVNQALKKFLKPDSLTITVLGTSERLKKNLSQKLGIPLSEITITPYTAE